MQELRASRSQVDQSGIVATSFEGVGDRGPAKVSLHTGEKLANVNSKSLSRGGRSSIIFQVIGDNSFGWAEAAALWGGDVDVIVHRQLSNHQINEQFNLPCSVPVALAPVPPSQTLVGMGSYSSPFEERTMLRMQEVYLRDGNP